ncbi:MAG: DUF3450 family protein [Campylobacterales bacterium]|nr:DUF3450 family protein [Campylobacterales bacterium]
MQTKFKKIVLSTTCLLALNTSTLNGDESFDNMVKSLMELRSEVGMLHTQISENNDAYKSNIKSLELQKNDLEAQIGRKSTFLKEVTQDIEKIREATKENSNSGDDLKPLLAESIEKLITHIKSSLPFKTDERVAELQKIKDQLETGKVTPQRALARVWSNYEDAFRLTKENGIFKDVIELNNESILVEVAKVGMMMLYFKTPDDRVGYLKDSKFTEVSDENTKKDILNLFDAMKKQIRTGYFTLPNTLAMGAK